MPRDTRKQPWQTFPFWFLILSGMAMTVAWKLDLLRPQPAEVATDAEAVEEEVAPDWANEAVEEDGLAVVEEPVEEAAEDVSPRSFPDESVADTAPEQGEPETAPATVEETPDAEAKGSENPFSRTDARLVSAHREIKPNAAFAPSNTLAEAAKLPDSPSSKSPFGPAKVEFQGSRRPGNAAQPAKNAAWPDAAQKPETAPEAFAQTASLDSQDVIPASATDSESVGTKPQRAMPTTDEAVDFKAIDQLIDDGEDVEANFQLSNLYWKRPEIRKQLMDRLRTVSYRIYFAPQPHYMDGHVVQAGDLLQNIAKDYDVSWEYLAKLNRTDAKKIRPGQKLKVIRGPFSAVVDLSDMEMTVHSHGHYVHAFPVGIGKDSSSPIGTFKVLEKLRDPTYYGPDGVVNHDDPQNPLGEYWIDLGDSYGIHGTNDESSIGKAESQGCIRMKSRDISDVYDLLTLDSEVLIKR